MHLNSYAKIISHVLGAVRAKKKSQIFLDSVAAVAIAFAFYHLLQAFVITQSSITLYVIHTSGTILLVCLSSIGRRLRSTKRSYYHLAFPSFIAALAIMSLLYIATQSDRLQVDWPWISNTDVVMSSLLFFAVLVSTWFAFGPILTTVGVVGILYFLFGNHLPGLLGHSGVSVHYAVSYLGTSLKTGMFWLIPLSVTAIFPLMVFGLVIRATRATEAFTELMKAAGRISKVAPVYTCVLESGLVGMVTGAPNTNVVLTGCVTIPAMKGIGLRAETAGGLEALASTGSQLVPPIMGLAAFVMAQLIGVPYIEVMIAAIIPVALYYLALLVSAYFAAVNDLEGKDIRSGVEQIEWNKVYRLLPSFCFPLGLLIFLLLCGFSPLYATCWATIGLLVLSQLQGKFRPTFIDIAKGFRDGAILGSEIAVVLMSVGFLGQALMSTGLAVRLSQVFTMIIGESFALSLVVLMMVSLIIGMGAPTVVAYVVCAIAVVPAVQDLGVSIMVAHFFTFYFASFSHITPPVAAAVVTACQLSGSKFLPTALQSVRLSWPLFLVPFIFTFHPEILEPSKLCIHIGLIILAYFLTLVSGIAVIYSGLPGLRMGITCRGPLVIAVISGIGYVFSDANAWLLTLLGASLVGWGGAFLRNRTSR